MWVAKIGGSLHAQAGLDGWLRGLCADRARRWLLVPGGGPYADAVRAEQRRLGYDDAEAHARAMLAMGRYGDALLRRIPAERLDSLAACAEYARSARAGPGLWCPSRQDAAAFPELPMDWRVTSDSLAYALARYLQAEAVLLVKSVEPPARVGARALAEGGWIDVWLPQQLAASAVPAYWTTVVGGQEKPDESACCPRAMGRLFL